MSGASVGVAALLVLAVVCAGLIAAVVVKTRNDAAVAAREAADYTPPPLAAPTGGTASAAPGAAADRSRIVVLGDQSVSSAARGIGAAERWPRLLGTALKADVTTLTAPRAGFAASDESGRTIGDLVGRIPTDADVVVLVGGAADDAAASLSISRAATQAIGDVRKRVPEAAVVLVGPLVPDGAPDPELAGVRNALQASARIDDVRWQDPIGDDWFGDAAPATSTALGATEEKAVVRRLRPVVDKLLQ